MPLSRIAAAVLAAALTLPVSVPAVAAPSAPLAPAAPAEVVAEPQGADQQSIPVEGVDPEATPAPGTDVEELAALSGPTETIDFMGAGLTWEADPADPVTEVQVRVREESGWSDWESLEVHPSPRTAESTRTGTEPLLTSGADAIEASVSTQSGQTPEDLTIELIDPGVAPSDGQVGAATRSVAPEAAESVAGAATSGTTTPDAAARAVAADAQLRPQIVTRAQWGADESWATDSSLQDELQAMYVHHTAGPNGYTPQEATQQLRAIYQYHSRSLQWGDIGYHFLVDRFGTIYEGRRGSMERLLLGTQAGGFNTNTIGISAMGNYDEVAAPQVMVDALESVLAWQAARYGLDPMATTTLTSRATPGSTARYPAGTRVTVPTILGHRDTNATACPGRYLYPLLPQIRANVAETVARVEIPEAVELAAPTLPSSSYLLSSDGMSAKASWNAVPGATGYQIMYRAVPHAGGALADASWLAGRTVTGTSTTLATDPGETAEFAVRALNGTTAGPQTVLGQHTGPVSWSDASAVTLRGASLTARADGIGRQAVRTSGSGASVQLTGAATAQTLTLRAESLAAPVHVEISRGGTVIGGMRFHPGGVSVCTLPLSGMGADLTITTHDDATLDLLSAALTRTGQSAPGPQTATACEVSFVDNPYGSPYFAAVHWMQWANISKGYAVDNTFRKTVDISRGESLAFLYRLADPAQTASAQTPFTDVPPSHTFARAISWASGQGIAVGYADGTYRPSQSVTRGEFAALVHRAAGGQTPGTVRSPFGDVKPSTTHHEAILWMVEQGLIAGYADGTFRPGQEITRAEVAVILHRYATATGRI